MVGRSRSTWPDRDPAGVGCWHSSCNFSCTDRGPEQQPIRDAKRSEAAAASTLPSADELVSAVLLFQLMQCLEVEIEPGDEPTRSLLRLVVRSAADGDAGWSRIDAALRAAAVCERERMAVDADSDTTTADLTELLQFDRHSVVPQYYDPDVDYMGQGLMEGPAWTRERHEFRRSDLQL